MKLLTGLLIPALFYFIFTGCNSPNPKIPPQADSMKIADAIKPIKHYDTIKDFSFLQNTSLKRWIDFYKTKYPGLNLNSFKLQNCIAVNPDSLWTRDDDPTKEYFDLYKTLLVYSPDKTMFIDMDSYNFLLERDKKGNLIGMGGDPETEVALIDIKRKTNKRLLYNGPSTIIEDAAWIGGDKIAIGYLSDENNLHVYNQYLLLIDLTKKTFSFYENSLKIGTENIHDYLFNVRWKSIKIKE
jgi:hypothetical protein